MTAFARSDSLSRRCGKIMAHGTIEIRIRLVSHCMVEINITKNYLHSQTVVVMAIRTTTRTVAAAIVRKAVPRVR